MKNLEIMAEKLNDVEIDDFLDERIKNAEIRAKMQSGIIESRPISRQTLAVSAKPQGARIRQRMNKSQFDHIPLSPSFPSQLNNKSANFQQNSELRESELKNEPESELDKVFNRYKLTRERFQRSSLLDKSAKTVRPLNKSFSNNSENYSPNNQSFQQSNLNQSQMSDSRFDLNESAFQQKIDKESIQSRLKNALETAGAFGELNKGLILQQTKKSIMETAKRPTKSTHLLDEENTVKTQQVQTELFCDLLKKKQKSKTLEKHIQNFTDFQTADSLQDLDLQLKQNQSEFENLCWFAQTNFEKQCLYQGGIGFQVVKDEEFGFRFEDKPVDTTNKKYFDGILIEKLFDGMKSIFE